MLPAFSHLTHTFVQPKPIVMIVKDNAAGKLIILSKAFDNRPKILNIFYFLVYTITGGIIFFTGIIKGYTGDVWHNIFVSLMLVFYLILGYRFINKAVQSEHLLLTPETLTITKKGFLSKAQRSYQTIGILNFRHLDKPQLAPHPLAGQTFDYLGFQTTDKVINEMHGDNRLAFDYKDVEVQFGENMYSWDFEQLQTLFYEVAYIEPTTTSDVEDSYWQAERNLYEGD